MAGKQCGWGRRTRGNEEGKEEGEERRGQAAASAGRSGGEMQMNSAGLQRVQVRKGVGGCGLGILMV